MNYYYFPVLKTRPSEVSAYENLPEDIKDGILPIIEMTGALGYTYPKNYKIENLRGTKRPGDISKKRKKIMDLVENRRFILDITDDESLKYYGLSEKEGDLLDPSNGYKAWLSFLTIDKKFKDLVIPTIQFDTNYAMDVMRQMESLDKEFEYIAIKLPAFLSSPSKFDSSIVFNDKIQAVIDFISEQINIKKLILILDFGYVSSLSKYSNFIKQGLGSLGDLSELKAVIPVSSSFPNFVVKAEKPIEIEENKISTLLKECIKTNNIYHGDFAAIHPTIYKMGGGGWIPRIDYIVRDETTHQPIQYDYVRGTKRNTSSEYFSLAVQVALAPNYKPIQAEKIFGDNAIYLKTQQKAEGNAPSYWISVRSNLYMAAEFLHLKEKGSFLTL